jgi:hypothetical protein
MIQVIEILIFVCLAGFFDGMMDNIKDSTTNFLYLWCLKNQCINWYKYGSHQILPWLKCKYNPAYPWSSDGWHMMKHGMILSYTGAIACLFACAVTMFFDLGIYYEIIIQIVSWACFDALEGIIFSKTYRG